MLGIAKGAENKKEEEEDTRIEYNLWRHRLQSRYWNKEGAEVQVQKHNLEQHIEWKVIAKVKEFFPEQYWTWMKER